MCQLSKPENGNNAATTKPKRSLSSSIKNDGLSGKKVATRKAKKCIGSLTDNSSLNGITPAFRGARFDKRGYCLHHASVQLVNPVKNDSGKLVYEELKATCPSCQSAKHKSKKTTSLGGGKVRRGHRVHGAPASSSRSRSRSRSASRELGNNGQPLERRGSRSRSKSRDRDTRSRRPEFDTPFDLKGRCHHHKSVQLAAKKMTGGWKVLQPVCPKCVEDKFDDDRSIRSGSSRKSTRSEASGSVGAVRGNANGKFNKNGCCVLHPHIQVAKKRVFGTGFKVLRDCPACDRVGAGDDDYSVHSGRSGRSTSSRTSNRSVRSNAKPGKASKSGRYGVLPFDGDGYCCRHPNVQLARKKALGGFKIIHNVCPECAREDCGSDRSGRRGSKPSRRGSSGTGRVFDDSGSETSSFRSGRSGVASGSGGSSRMKKRIRVRNLKTEDENGKAGRYSGYVNEGHRPHGNGVMKYADGSVYDGVWSEGTKVHGKTKRG